MFACARTDVRVFLCLEDRGSRAYVPTSTCVGLGFVSAGAFRWMDSFALLWVLICAGIFGWVDSLSQVRACSCVLILRVLEMR